jgi:hypothetical protein
MRLIYHHHDPDAPNPSPKYLRPNDVIARYRISIATVYRWLHDEKLGGISKDGITLVEVESLEAYLRTWKPDGKVKGK